MGFFSAKEVDPVCKMKVDPQTAAASLVWEGKTFYFCSPVCQGKFGATPERYLSGGSSGHGM